MSIDAVENMELVLFCSVILQKLLVFKSYSIPSDVM